MRLPAVVIGLLAFTPSTPQEEVSSKLLERAQSLQAACWSPDGRFVAASDTQGTVTLWDVETGKVVRDFVGHRGYVKHVAFSRDGTRIASADDSDVRLREIFSLKEPLILKAKTSQPAGMGFSPDSAFLAVGDLNYPIHLWDGREGKLLRRVGRDSGGTHFGAFSPDGTSVATLTGTIVTLWDPATGAERLRIHDEREDGKPPEKEEDEFPLFLSLGELKAIAFTPCGRFLLTDDGESVRIRDLGTGRQVARFDVGKHRASAFSPDGRLVAVTREQSVRLWEIASGKLALEIKDERVDDDFLVFSPEGRRLLAESWKGVRVWDLAAPKKKDLSRDEGEALWTALAGEDVPAAFQAIRALAAAGAAAAGLLKQRFPAPPEEEVNQRVSELDGEDPAGRDKAARALEGLAGAEPSIRRARERTGSAEVRARLDEVLKTLSSPATRSSGRLRLIRTVQALELMGSRAAQDALAAFDSQDARLALARLKARESLAASLLKLEEASRDPYRQLAADPALKGRVEQVKGVLSPALLKAMPAVEVRLAQGGARAWTGVFLEAIAEEEVPFVGLPRRRFPGLAKHDLEPVVIRALDGVETSDEMGAVCEWIEWRRVTAAIPRLRELLKHDDPYFQLYAGKTLAAFAHEEGAAPIIALLGHRDLNLKYRAAVAAGQLRLKAAVPGLLELLGNKMWLERQAAARALARIGAKEAVPALKRILAEDKNEETRTDVIAALAELGEREAAVAGALALLETQRRSHEGSRLMAVLGRHGGAAAVPRVMEWFEKNERDHYMIFPHLRFFEGKNLGPEIAKLLSHKDHQIKRKAIDLLAELDAVDRIADLAGVLKDGHPMDQAHALKALASLGAKEYVPQMREALKQEHPWMRSWSAEALSLLRDRASVDQIVPLLKDTDSGVRESAALALARLGARDSTAAIVEVLKARSQERNPRIPSAVALCLLGSKEGIGPLLKHSEEWGSALPYMNALRQPEPWKKLEDTPLGTDLYGPSDELWARLAKAAGLECDDSEMRHWYYRPGVWSWGDDFVRSRGGRTTLAEALAELTWWGRGSFILERDRLIVLPHFQALEFWKRWARE